MYALRAEVYHIVISDARRLSLSTIALIVCMHGWLCSVVLLARGLSQLVCFV